MKLVILMGQTYLLALKKDLTELIAFTTEGGYVFRRIRISKLKTVNQLRNDGMMGWEA